MVAELENVGLSFVLEKMRQVGVWRSEFKSRPGKPSPLSLGLIAAASGQQEAVMQGSVTVGTKNSLTNGIVALKPYQNGVANKPANGQQRVTSIPMEMVFMFD